LKTLNISQVVDFTDKRDLIENGKVIAWKWVTQPVAGMHQA
jgi:hypothetical protein